MIQTFEKMNLWFIECFVILHTFLRPASDAQWRRAESPLFESAPD